MVHFPVLVAGTVEDQLDLFGPTPLDSDGRWPLPKWRAEFDDAVAALREKPVEEVADLSDVAAVLTYWLGDPVHRAGPDEYVIESETNPDARYDYYRYGGGYEGILLDRDGEWVDEARKRDVDYAAMRRLARAEAEERFTAFAEATGGLDRPVPYADWLTGRQGHPEWNAELAEEYGRIPWVAAAAPFSGVQEVQETFCLDAPDPRRAYVEGRVRAAGVTEVLLAGATWHTRLDVEGDDVWGVPSEAWVAAFWRVLDAVPDDARLTVIDCHA